MHLGSYRTRIYTKAVPDIVLPTLDYFRRGVDHWTFFGIFPYLVISSVDLPVPSMDLISQTSLYFPLIYLHLRRISLYFPWISQPGGSCISSPNIPASASNLLPISLYLPWISHLRSSYISPGFLFISDKSPWIMPWIFISYLPWISHDKSFDFQSLQFFKIKKKKSKSG